MDGESYIEYAPQPKQIPSSTSNIQSAQTSVDTAHTRSSTDVQTHPFSAQGVVPRHSLQRHGTVRYTAIAARRQARYEQPTPLVSEPSPPPPPKSNSIPFCKRAPSSSRQHLARTPTVNPRCLPDSLQSTPRARYNTPTPVFLHKSRYQKLIPSQRLHPRASSTPSAGTEQH